MKRIAPTTLLLITVILMDLLTGMEFDLFVPSLPLLRHEFGLSISLVEALISVNFIGYCLSVFFAGPLSDRYGRKRVIFSGLLIFTIGSLLCLYSTTYSALIIGRVLQGIGIAPPSILSFLIIADTYPSLKKQQYFMAMLNGIMNTSIAISPIAGSYITLYFHWQGNFTALLLLGSIILIMSLFFIPTHQPLKSKGTLSLSGYTSLWRSKPLMLLIINLTFLSIPYWIFVGLSPLLYMKELGVSLAHFGFYQGILALSFAIGSVWLGLIMHRYQLKSTLKIAGYLYFISLLTMAVITFMHHDSPLLITFALLMLVISQIIPSNLLTPVCLNFVSDKKGRTSALLRSAQCIFSTMGLQIASYVYTGLFEPIGIILIVCIIMVIITHSLVCRQNAIIQAAEG